jgi:hypothetical protein
MSEHIGLLFADGSILVLPEGTTIATAKKEAEEHDAGDPDPETRVVSLVVRVVEVITEAVRYSGCRDARPTTRLPCGFEH